MLSGLGAMGRTHSQNPCSEPRPRLDAAARPHHQHLRTSTSIRASTHIAPLKGLIVHHTAPAIAVNAAALEQNAAKHPARTLNTRLRSG